MGMTWEGVGTRWRRSLFPNKDPAKKTRFYYTSLLTKSPLFEDEEVKTELKKCFYTVYNKVKTVKTAHSVNKCITEFKVNHKTLYNTYGGKVKHYFSNTPQKSKQLGSNCPAFQIDKTVRNC